MLKSIEDLGSKGLQGSENTTRLPSQSTWVYSPSKWKARDELTEFYFLKSETKSMTLMWKGSKSNDIVWGVRFTELL